jgi:hypothetical protein
MVASLGDILDNAACGRTCVDENHVMGFNQGSGLLGYSLLDFSFPDQLGVDPIMTFYGGLNFRIQGDPAVKGLNLADFRQQSNVAPYGHFRYVEVQGQLFYREEPILFQEAQQLISSFHCPPNQCSA